MVCGRFAPSPTGSLHLGNLRTALLSWLLADPGCWLVRIEDLDRVTSSVAHEHQQLSDLAALGLRPDGPVVRQSERFDRYRSAIATLAELDLVYPCYCTRREIREAVSAPHQLPVGAAPEGAYPGTCRDLDRRGRGAREREGRPAALRFRSDGAAVTVTDLVCGSYTGLVDDVVLQRADGVPAYNLAVVVDDAAQGVDIVVRGDDLLSSTPRQVALQRHLGLPTPIYAHVALVVGVDRQRLSKRHGAVTLADLAERDIGVEAVRAWLASTIGVPAGVDLDRWRDQFDLAMLSRDPVIVDLDMPPFGP